MNVDCIEDALALIKACSIRNIKFKGMPPIDWDAWKDRVNSFQQSSSSVDELAILRYSLDELNDGHSGIPNEISTTPTKQKPAMPSGMMLGKTGYIRLPPYNKIQGYDETILASDPYVKAIQNILSNLDKSEIDGWIVDLRINTGGDYRPMLEGIASLLGSGTHAYLLYPLFEIENPCSIDTQHRLKQAEKPIAVLTGSHTSSSGELILIAFQKLNNVMSFGESSGGNSSSNMDFTFKNRHVAVTAGLMADRNKVPYGDKIHPDVHFTGGASPEEIKSENYNPAIDPLTIRAMKWIHQAKNPRFSITTPAPSPL